MHLEVPEKGKGLLVLPVALALALPLALALAVPVPLAESSGSSSNMWALARSSLPFIQLVRVRARVTRVSQE